MRKKVNIKIPSSEKDSGKSQFMRGEKGFQEMARSFSEMAVHDQVLRKYSEFKRPYAADNYQQMEHFGDPPPGMTFYGPFLPDIPGIDWTDPDFDRLYNPWHLTFYCLVDPCWCEGEKKCFSARCTHEIVDVQWTFRKPKGLSIEFSKYRICLTAEEDINPLFPSITIKMKSNIPKGGGLWQGKFDVVYGEHANISVSKCRDSECETCDGTTPVAFNTGASDDSIDRAGGADNTSDLVITGTGTPFTWTVTGTGFTLDYAETVGLANVLTADGTACGAAKVTVTDCDGNTADFLVKCSTGSWHVDGQYAASACQATAGHGCTLPVGKGFTMGSGTTSFLDDAGIYRADWATWDSMDFHASQQPTGGDCCENPAGTSFSFSVYDQAGFTVLDVYQALNGFENTYFWAGGWLGRDYEYWGC